MSSLFARAVAAKKEKEAAAGAADATVEAGVELMTCSHCGAPRRREVLSCHYCGGKL